jgi:F0F1-type ATP synthase assembly protein I
VFNSLVANRRLAFRLVAVQLAVATVVTSGFALQDARSAIAAAFGGGAVVVGSAVLAWRSLFGPALSAGTALARMVSGLQLKSFVVLGALSVALARLGLPPLPLLSGLAATMFASFLTQGFQAKGVQ